MQKKTRYLSMVEVVLIDELLTICQLFKSLFFKKRRKNHNKTYYNCNDHIKLSKNERILMMIQLKSLENLTSHVAHY